MSIDWRRLTNAVRRPLLVALAWLLLGCSRAPAGEMPAPNDLAWEPFVGQLEMPVDLQSTTDGRLFVVERSGHIHELADGRLRAEPFLDLSSQVTIEGGEQGLLGLAFHPAFAGNRRFFVHYTDRAGNTVIAGYQAAPGGHRADPATAQTILSVEQPDHNHNGGPLVFGPDGYLYIGLGDGGGAGDPGDHGQRLDTLLGKVLRIDVDGGRPYGLPADNPFLDHPTARPEIWAYGLRNPWRLTFDPVSGDLLIADVGQDRWEEVNLAPAGAGGWNFGWNRWEGAHPFAGGGEGTVPPIAEYDHDEGCAITGGPVIGDPTLPGWRGVYLYGDACSGRIWGLRPDASGWQGGLLFDTDLRISTFGVGPDGEVLVADYRDQGARLLRLVRRPN